MTNTETDVDLDERAMLGERKVHWSHSETHSLCGETDRSKPWPLPNAAVTCGDCIELGMKNRCSCGWSP